MSVIAAQRDLLSFSCTFVFPKVMKHYLDFLKLYEGIVVWQEREADIKIIIFLAIHNYF